MPKLFRVGRARTGLGLFATRRIPNRKRIVEYKGPLMTGDEADRAERRGNRYMYELNSKWTIDGTPRSNVARYANHSCNPNAKSMNNGRQVFISAIRAIKPGEEITYNYGRPYFKYVITASGCQCARCRKRRAKKARERRAQKVKVAARTSGKAVKKRAKAVPKNGAKGAAKKRNTAR